MPLRRGTSPDAISENIAELVRAGRGPDEAAAIAYGMARGAEDRAAGIMYRAAGRVLLLLRSANASDHPGTWCFPAGSIDEGETPEQAAMRESQEEVGFTPVQALTPFDWADGFTTFCVELPGPFAPVLNHEHDGYVWADPQALPQPMHPGCLATLACLPVPGVAMDKREYDGNGWFEIKANPISRVGVFPYAGRQLGLTGPDADRIFQVLRPAEELADPACVESFRLLPWIDDHTMIGPAAQEMTPSALPAERKGIHGVIGEDVFFAETPELPDGGLFANIKAFSSTLAALIRAGKRELSAGYRCIYDMTSGVWNGQRYDAVQRKIRGNHLALVTEGRMGPSVAVMDRFTFSFDAKEIEMSTTETKDGGSGTGAMTLEQATAMLAELAPQVAKLTEAFSKLQAPAAPAAPEGDKAPASDAKPEGEGAPEGAVTAPAMDAALKPLRDQIASMTAQAERTAVQSIAKRDALARRLSQVVGTFDHSDKTYADVVAYGCDKLGIKAQGETAEAMLSGYLMAAPATPSRSVAMDAAPAASEGNFVARHLTTKKGE